MTEAMDANKARNREIAQNEEVRQVAGSARVSIWAIGLAVAIGVVLLALGWIAVRS